MVIYAFIFTGHGGLGIEGDLQDRQTDRTKGLTGFQPQTIEQRDQDNTFCDRAG